MSRAGSGYGLLHDFAGSEDGQAPRTGLLAGSDGVLYGITPIGGNTGYGTIFRIMPDANGYQILHSFTGLNGDGRTPKGSLIEGSDGSLYGTTSQGGAAGKGVVFGISKDGITYRTLWQFGGLPLDGETSTGTLTQANDGTILGCTEAGGDVGYGTIFRVDPVLVVLALEHQGATVSLRWPISSTDDQLEEANSLNGGVGQWTPTDLVPSTSGNEHQVTIPIETGARLFRVTRNWK